MKVFYNPEALNDGVLEPGIYLDIWLFIGSGGFFFLMAYLFKVGIGFNKIGNIITIGRIMLDTMGSPVMTKKKHNQSLKEPLSVLALNILGCVIIPFTFLPLFLEDMEGQRIFLPAIFFSVMCFLAANKIKHRKKISNDE